MADNTKIWPIFRWANWWLSDDLFTGIRNSFYYSNDMEIREDAKSIFPKWVPAYADTDKRFTIWSWDTSTNALAPVAILYWANDYGWLIFTKRDIYLVSSPNTVTKLCRAQETICDAEIFNWYIYIATSTHLYYKKDNGALWGDLETVTDASDPNVWVCTQTLTSYNWHPLYSTSSILCVWDANVVRKVTKEIPDTLQDWFTLQKDYWVRHINELWWFVRVSAVNKPYWSEILLWDKVSTYPDEVIPMEWYTILQSAIYNWYHYLLSNKWLWLLNWYQYYLLKRADWDVESKLQNWMVVYDDKLFFIANQWLYIYWAKNKNYNDVLWLWHKEDGATLWALWASEYWIATSIAWHYSSTPSERVPIYVGINEWQATTWEVQTMCYFGNSMSEIKQSMYLRVGYHIAKEWSNTWNIHIYYRTEADATDDNPDNWAWHPVTKPDWLYADWDMRSPFATTLKLNCRFQWIQFKFVLTNCVYTDWADTLTKDTNLYSADLYYNDMLD